MNILVIADAKVPVPPIAYGGAERVIANLCAELQSLGHTVDLIASPESRSFGGKLIPHRPPTRSLPSRAFRKGWFQIVCLPAVQRADVIVNFGRLDYLWCAIRSGKPIIACFQNPVDQPEIDWLLERRKYGIHLIGVSHSQVEGLVPAELISVVHNSTDTRRTPYFGSVPPDSYLAFLGRVTKNKGADTAIRVAKLTGRKLKLAGNISDEPGGREFFEQEIRPQLDSQIEWIGPVNDAAKEQLLGGASALLFPIRWKEPCAVVLPETLACGTPIIAFRCASTPEVIEHGITGFLCDSEDEMVEAVAKIPHIDRAACRKAAEEGFSVTVMTQRYLRVINELLDDQS